MWIGDFVRCHSVVRLLKERCYLWIASYGTEPARPAADVPTVVLGGPGVIALGAGTLLAVGGVAAVIGILQLKQNMDALAAQAAWKAA